MRLTKNYRQVKLKISRSCEWVICQMSEHERIRLMRLMLFFDLPSVTSEEKREYRHFVKFLEHEGFIRLQYSVFVKLVLNDGLADAAVNRVKRYKLPDGLVHILRLPESQYAAMECVFGEDPRFDELNTTVDLVVI